MMSSAVEPITVRLGHSPDADDIFMWWPLASQGGRPSVIDTSPFRFQLVAEDIEQLNARSEAGELEITGISMAHYPLISGQYALTTCGSSFGLGYGPKLVSVAPTSLEELRNRGGVIGVAGLRTSGYAVARLLLGEDRFQYVPMPFEEIPLAVERGEIDAGVVIHEGQLTYRASGLHLICDLGEWWEQRSGGPIPLGGNVIRRDLDERWGVGRTTQLATLLHESIAYSMAHREEALSHCLALDGGLQASMDRQKTIDQFVALYVNELTIDLGASGKKAVECLFGEMSRAGFAPDVTDVAFVHPEGV